MNNSKTAIDGTATQSNSLVHKIMTKDIHGNTMQISIRLNDDCKNGHQDFAITGTIWEKGKPLTDRNTIAGGRIHDDILKAHPELKIFVDLHLCDFSGAPMHAQGNGFYHIRKMTKQEFIEYFNCNVIQYDILSQAEDKTHFNYLIQSCGVAEDWKILANKAILLLERYTGLKFVNDSKRSQYTPLDKGMFETVKNNIKNGYYSPVNIEERKLKAIQDAKDKVIAELTASRDKDIQKANDEFNVKMEILRCGLSIDNFIYYTHTNKGVFNWKSYESKISINQLEKFKSDCNFSILPDGIIFELDTKNK